MNRVLRHGLPLLAALALVLVGVKSASRLRVDARIEALLPAQENQRAERDARVIAERSDLRPPFRVLVAAPTLGASRRAARRVRDALRAWPETEWAIDTRNLGALWTSRALYLELDEANALSDAVVARVEWERCEAMPGCISLEERPVLPSEEELFEGLQASASVRALVDGGQSAADGQGAARSPNGSIPMCSEDASGAVCAVEARLRVSASDVDAGSAALARARGLFAELGEQFTEEGLDGVRMEVTGAYRNAPIIRQGAAEDLQRTSVLTLLLLAGLGFLSLRSVRAVLLVFTPLAVALGGTIFCVATWGGPLNLIGAFTFAILAGVGVDFGVHLLSHYDGLRAGARSLRRGAGAERTAFFRALAAWTKRTPRKRPAETRTTRSPTSAEAAARRAIAELGASMNVAALTTAVAFGSLALTDFPGFQQTGRIAALGIAFSWLSYRVLFVPIVSVFEAVVPERGSLVRTVPQARNRAFVRPLAVLLICLGAGAILHGRTGFETNFRALRPAAAFNQIESRGALGPARGTLVAMSADDPEALVALDASAFGEGAFVLTPDVLPSQQVEKLEAFGRARRALSSVHAECEACSRARALLVERPVSPSDIPVWLRAGLVEANGRFGRLGVAYVPMSGADARAMEALNARLDALRAQHPGVRFSAPASALGVVVPQLRADALSVVLLVLVALLFVVGMAARDARRLADVLFALALASSMSWALMGFFGVKLNLYNVLVLPVAFGVGVDGAVYTVWSKGHDARRGILLGTLTTLAAFFSLLFANNPGLSSIGTLASITLSASLVTNLVLLPAWMRRRSLAMKRF